MAIPGLYRAASIAGAVLGDLGATTKGRQALGYWPNLIRPRTFNEKTLARKLHPYHSWSLLADKWRVRALVPPEYLNEVYAVETDAGSLLFSALPSSYVIKATHGSGMVRIVEDASAVDPEEIREQCRAWLADDYGRREGEPWYSAIRPRIMVERFLRDERYGVPLDFKVWCFHGRAEVVQVDIDRQAGHKRAMYGRDWSRLPWSHAYPPGPEIPRPCRLGEMLKAAEHLARGHDFLRVDLYSPDDGPIVFGELTLAPDGGWGRFDPPEWDRRVGDLW